MSDERRAIEALRAGVPNRVAIRLLGTAETTISERFVENLQCCKTQLNEGGQATGQVIAGGFGTGKSHLLGYLQYVALKENFIGSWSSSAKRPRSSISASSMFPRFEMPPCRSTTTMP